MSLERKELINLHFGLDAYETWEDLVRNTTEQGWGFYLLPAAKLVHVRSRSNVTLEQREAWVESIETQRQRDREALSEADSVQITTARIDPRTFSYVNIFDGKREKLYPREFGALVAAAGRTKEDVLKLLNTAAANIRKADSQWTWDPIWGREGNMQMYADFFRKPVVSFISDKLKQEYLPNPSSLK